jgi:SAM-dependent methyltransferase
MTATHQTLEDQSALWNGPAGRAWVDGQALLDRMYQPIEDLLMEAVAAKGPAALLDVGCGTGATTLAAARRLGPAARCLGVDISQPMIDAARARAAREQLPATFTCADAQTHPFEAASVDMIVSRFGVMFFADPVAAFANLRRAARPGASLLFVAWRSAAENPFMTTAERAAAPLLPNLPARRPDAPGQFAFGDARRVRDVLAASGWVGIDARPADVVCTFPEQELVGYLTRHGPVGLALQGADERTRNDVVETIRRAFDAYVHGGDVRFTAACWVVGARAT